MDFRGRQDHYDTYVEDFSIFQMADGSKVVEFEENPIKTRQGVLRNPTRHPSKLRMHAACMLHACMHAL